MTLPSDFHEFFKLATGVEPYDYQRRLAAAESPPSVLMVPTGSGKTAALIGSWLYARRILNRGPRRLVYALPMRTLVEQTRDVAGAIREHLHLPPEELPIHTLMGGESPADWREAPERDQILVGTIDMLLSRALNRGYAESRFAWPVSFGLLNADCRWVFDEVQLMGPARSTSAQLDGLRAKLGTGLPCETIWASATVDREPLVTVDRPDLGEDLRLSDGDRRGRLATRLKAPKQLERLDISTTNAKSVAKQIAETAVERHAEGTRTLIVLNRVDRAQGVFKQLAKLTESSGSPSAVLLHSRFRPRDRSHHLDAALAEPAGRGTIVVSTQVVEAGVDLSSRTLVTETAPFSSIVQRLGRCNRSGEFPDGASVVWLDGGFVADDAAGQRLAAPYLPVDLERARAALLELEGKSLCPAAVEQIEVKESVEDPASLRRRDLLDLFDTSPDLSGTDIDIAPFIREDDERSITVFFRELERDPDGRISGAGESSPAREELLQAPLASLDAERAAWVVDHVDGDWVQRRRDVPPGAVVLLSAADGGYDSEIGWAPKLKTPVEPVAVDALPRVEAVGDDPRSEGAQPVELVTHLQAVADEAFELAAALGLGEWRESLRAAGALHDLGKAHWVFQETLRSAMGLEEEPDAPAQQWAKSGRRGGRRPRRNFRHELASALVVIGSNSVVDERQRHLIAYLIAAHHGKVRLSIRPAPGEQRPDGVPQEARFALGVADGDVLPHVETPVGLIPATTLDLSPMELGADISWTDAVVGLRDDPELGPFRLGFLEALLRVADWRASDA